ncbi:MAG: YebC/PmpR family DNA-binding transcriptional regulator [Clostridia bacterium]
MSGHSKWKNILHKKEKTDSQRAKIFTKIGREMAVAVREGGADASSNSKLRDCIAKARASNVPNDNIKRIIERASGDGATYETITYEGYGPSGVAVIVDTMTDNRNRTAAEMRHYFDKFGGNLGASGCVSWQFDKKGVIVIEKVEGQDEDERMLEFVEAGADDVSADGDVFEVFTDPDDFSSVCEALEALHCTVLSAEVEKVPQNYIELTSEEDLKNMQKLLDALDDNDDVSSVYHNWDE